MALEAASLYATLGLDASGYKKGLADAKGGLNDFGGVLGGVGKIAGGILVAGLAVGTAAVVGLTAATADFVGEAMNAQDVAAQLDAVIRSTGGAAGITADMATNLADTLSQVTRFDDEAIVSGESLLLTFTKIGRDVFPLATQTMLDMSQALGQDLKASAIQLGKALNDPITGVTALRRVGVQFTDQQETQIKKLVESGHLLEAQKLILAELQTEFGGAARAAGSTFGGQMDILGTKIGNVKEKIGAALLPALSQVAGALTSALATPEAQAAIDKIATTVGNVGANLAALAIEYGPKIAATFGDFFTKMQETLPGVAVIFEDAFTRIGAALGITSGKVTTGDALMGALKATLDMVVTASQLAAIGISGIASAVEAISAAVAPAIAGLKELIKLGEAAGKFMQGTQGTPGGAEPNAFNYATVPGTYDTGGIVPGPLGSRQMIAAQGGETVLPIGGSQIINLIVDGQVLASIVTGHQARQGTQVRRMGGAAAL